LEIVEFLLYEKKLDINCNESSPLFYASSMGRSKMVLFLLQNGALIRPNGYEQETSLHVAAGTNPDMWVEREGVDFSTIDMLSVVKILVEHGADVNAVHRYGETPLHQAAFVQNYAIVKYLLEHHADINKKDKYGRTALHQAVFTNKDNRVCALLLENGANASSKNDKGQSPILWGYSNVDTSTIHLLMRFGYNPFQDVDNEGYTLLHRALQHQQYTTIYFLLDNKVNVNATTKMGTTPFHIAAGLRGAAGLNILKRLIQDGALINQKDTFGHTPLSGVCHVIESDHGTYYPDSLVVNFLRSQGAHE
jgi:ankyrin repeat protein